MHCLDVSERPSRAADGNSVRTTMFMPKDEGGGDAKGTCLMNNRRVPIVYGC